MYHQWLIFKDSYFSVGDDLWVFLWEKNLLSFGCVSPCVGHNCCHKITHKKLMAHPTEYLQNILQLFMYWH